MKRKPFAAGKFYPSSVKELKTFIKEAISSCDIQMEGQLKGILVPHAGYIYSGKTAAMAYARMRDKKISTVIIMGSGHVKYLDKAVVPASDYFITPIGEIEVDAYLRKEFLSSGFFSQDESAHSHEHSIEVQLPFLQEIVKDKFKILPVTLNSHNVSILSGIGKTIGQALKKEDVFLVLSSDLSHYPPAKDAFLSDNALLEAYRMAIGGAGEGYFSLAFQLLSSRFPNMDTPACGFSAMLASIAALQEIGVNFFEKIHYTNSSDISGDNSSVVGYGCGAFYRSNGSCLLELSNEEKKNLLLTARVAIEKKLTGRKFSSIAVSYKFLLPAALFITLKSGDNLRGCIGCLQPHMLLDEAVEKYALAAAFEDSRFKPLEAKELDKVNIEISILSPLREISSHEEIKLGIDGVMIKKGNRSATYLPQVWKHFESKQDFMNSLCFEKAGLPKDCWQEKSTRIFTYRVDAFKEGDL